MPRKVRAEGGGRKGRAEDLRRVIFIGVLGFLIGGCASSRPQVELAYFPPPPARARVVHLKSFNNLSDLAHRPRSWTEAFRGLAPTPHVVAPAGIAYRDGHLYICDTGVNVVRRWDLAIGSAVDFGADGAAVLLKPVAVAVDDAGGVYVADTELAQVIAFRADGSVARRYWRSEVKDSRPVAVAVSGDRLAVADISDHRVVEYSIRDGEETGRFGGIGDGGGQFFFPMGLAAVADGGLAVADMMNSRVQVFDAARDLVLSFGQPGDRYGDMGKPRQVAIGPDGTYFVSDADFAYVHMFSGAGQLLMLLGGPDEPLGGTPLPCGVAVAPKLPTSIADLVPSDFHADYFLFVANALGEKRLSLYAVDATD